MSAVDYEVTPTPGGASGSLSPGRLISGRYRIVRRLSSGGMGTVYLAEHVSIEKAFALKVLAPDLAKHADLAARFLQEARVASRIRHENMVDISDFGQTEDGLFYFVMEYLDGQDLEATVKATGPLPWERARPIMLQVVSVLQAAHEQGIVHRDIKPANVVVCQRKGRQDFVKVLDFGVAKVLDSAKAKLVNTNRELEVLGTPLYMAPEQSQGEPVDGRTDVYACGCLLYHLLTGRPPFEGNTQFAVLVKQLAEAPAPPSSRLPLGTLSSEVDAIVLKALAKNPVDRWQGMRAMGAAIEAAADGAGSPTAQPGSSSPVGLPEPIQPWANGSAPTISVTPRWVRDGVRSPSSASRSRLRMALVGGLLGLAVLAGGTLLWSRQRGPQQDGVSRSRGDVTRSNALTSERTRQGAESPPGVIAPDALPATPVSSTFVPADGSPPSAGEARPRVQRKRQPSPSRGQRSTEPVFEPLADPALE